MIYTSYFAAMRKMTDEQKARCMSVARWTPKGISIPINTMLVPAPDILRKFKENGNQEAFAAAYMAMLEFRDPYAKATAKSMNDHILCCFEKPSDFCHRHILAQWLRDNGYKCEEFMTLDRNKKNGKQYFNSTNTLHCRNAEEYRYSDFLMPDANKKIMMR